MCVVVTRCSWTAVGRASFSRFVLRGPLGTSTRSRILTLSHDVVFDWPIKSALAKTDVRESFGAFVVSVLFVQRVLVLDKVQAIVVLDEDNTSCVDHLSHSCRQVLFLPLRRAVLCLDKHRHDGWVMLALDLDILVLGDLTVEKYLLHEVGNAGCFHLLEALLNEGFVSLDGFKIFLAEREDVDDQVVDVDVVVAVSSRVCCVVGNGVVMIVVVAAGDGRVEDFWMFVMSMPVERGGTSESLVAHHTQMRFVWRALVQAL